LEVTDVKELPTQKALSEILTTAQGMATEVRAVFSNALSPILFKEQGSTMELKLVQL
jgi:hypothetical protein